MWLVQVAPARVPEVITVGASNLPGKFSNEGQGGEQCWSISSICSEQAACAQRQTMTFCWFTNGQTDTLKARPCWCRMGQRHCLLVQMQTQMHVCCLHACYIHNAKFKDDGDFIYLLSSDYDLSVMG